VVRVGLLVHQDRVAVVQVVQVALVEKVVQAAQVVQVALSDHQDRAVVVQVGLMV